eukprot:scaffold81961_cov30-Tisochrysis_lutea.AAC.2
MGRQRHVTRSTTRGACAPRTPSRSNNTIISQRPHLRRRDGNGHLEACLVHHVRAEGRVDMLRLHVTPANLSGPIGLRFESCAAMNAPVRWRAGPVLACCAAAHRYQPRTGLARKCCGGLALVLAGAPVPRARAHQRGRAPHHPLAIGAGARPPRA